MFNRAIIVVCSLFYGIILFITSFFNGSLSLSSAMKRTQQKGMDNKASTLYFVPILIWCIKTSLYHHGGKKIRTSRIGTYCMKEKNLEQINAIYSFAPAFVLSLLRKTLEKDFRNSLKHNLKNHCNQDASNQLFQGKARWKRSRVQKYLQSQRTCCSGTRDEIALQAMKMQVMIIFSNPTEKGGN